MDNLIISVGRQLGSGGCEIAKLLAQSFDCKYYDTELINMAAERSGFAPKVFEKQDERHGTLKSLLSSFSGRLGRSTSNFYNNALSQESLFQVQSEVIWKAAKEDNCVFVGRCADYILRDRTDMLSVFITADLDWRAQQVISRHKCSKDEALKIIHNAESQRASYYNYYTGKRWGDSASYDLCVNSCRLGLDATAQLVRDFIVKSSKL